MSAARCFRRQFFTHSPFSQFPKPHRPSLPLRPYHGARVSLGDVQAFADSLTGLAQSSKAQTLAAIKSLLAFAHKIGYIPFNVGTALQLPKAKNTLAERILQESGVHNMIALEPSQRGRLILKTLYYGGFAYPNCAVFSGEIFKPGERRVR